MRSRTTSLLLAFILMLTASGVSPLSVHAQTGGALTKAVVAAPEDWQGLRDLEPGKKILVEFKVGIGDSVQGKFKSVSGSRLTLSSDGDTLSFEQRDILRVYRLKGRWSRGTTARIGAGIGMVIGTIIGTERMIRAEGEVGHIPSDEDTAPAFAGFALGTLAGAGLGALLGGKRKGKLLYEAK